MIIWQTTTPQHGAGTVLERGEQALKPPAIYKVLLLNDDHTPIGFIVIILRQCFSKDREIATQIMLTVHRESEGACSLYTRDIAATKAELVSTHARQADHPLQCVMEEA